MPLRIRLTRMGARNRPFFRIVVADSRSPRDGRFVETLGHYDPVKQPAEIRIDAAKAIAWLEKGALPTDTARSLLSKAGILKALEEKRAAAARERSARRAALEAQQPSPVPGSQQAEVLAGAPASAAGGPRKGARQKPAGASAGKGVKEKKEKKEKGRKGSTGKAAGKKGAGRAGAS